MNESIDEQRIREIKARRAEQMELIERFVTGEISMEELGLSADICAQVDRLRQALGAVSARSGTSPSDAGR